MPVRDVIVAAAVLGSLPFCFLRPWIGVLVFSWLGYMNPHRLTWDFAYNQPWAMMVALATLTGLLFAGKARTRLPRTAEVYLLLALWMVFVVSTFGAMQPVDAWDQLNKVSKILLLTFVSMVLFRDAEKLRYLIYVIALSIGFYGLKGGVWALGTGGGNMVLGPPETFIAGNTEIGLALVMVIPLLVLLARDEPRRRMRLLLRATFAFSVVAILFTYSRGAVLGLGMILPLIFLKSKWKALVIPLALVAALFGQSIAEAIFPEQWMARMGTVQTYEQDRSANMRLNSWIVAYRLALDHPFFGGGFRPFTPAVYLAYSPDDKWNTQQDAHSIYFQVLAEHGFVGLGLFLLLILATMVSLRRIMRRARHDPALKFHYNAAQMIEVSMIGYVVVGAFLSMSYFDLFYHLVAITALLRVLVVAHVAQRAPAPAGPRLPAPARRPTPAVALRPTRPAPRA